MNVDIIILSHAKNEELKNLTQQTIDSCLASENPQPPKGGLNNKYKDAIDFKILVMEQQPDVVYEGAKTHFISEAFNYNRFMNYGIEMTDSEYVGLCNNDLIFSAGWATDLIAAMKKYNLLSACPRCPVATRIKEGVVFGYNNSHHMSGWCIMVNRKLFEVIGKIDEDFPFWFADNAYAEQLKIHKVPHALVSSSVVQHLGSSTLNTLEAAMQHEYTRAYVRRFYTKYPRNESAVYFRKQLPPTP